MTDPVDSATGGSPVEIPSSSPDSNKTDGPVCFWCGAPAGAGKRFEFIMRHVPSQERYMLGVPRCATCEGRHSRWVWFSMALLAVALGLLVYQPRLGEDAQPLRFGIIAVALAIGALGLLFQKVWNRFLESRGDKMAESYGYEHPNALALKAQGYVVGDFERDSEGKIVEK